MAAVPPQYHYVDGMSYRRTRHVVIHSSVKCVLGLWAVDSGRTVIWCVWLVYRIWWHTEEVVGPRLCDDSNSLPHSHCTVEWCRFQDISPVLVLPSSILWVINMLMLIVTGRRISDFMPRTILAEASRSSSHFLIIFKSPRRKLGGLVSFLCWSSFSCSTSFLSEAFQCRAQLSEDTDTWRAVDANSNVKVRFSEDATFDWSYELRCLPLLH